MHENKYSEQRRDFLKKAGLLIGAGASVSALSSLIVGCQDETILTPLPKPGAKYIVDLSKFAVLAAVGGIATVTAPQSDDPKNILSFIIRRFADDKFIVVQSACSHQTDRELNPVADADGNTACPRHGAIFSLNIDTPGKVIADKGVAFAPLKSYAYTYIAPNTLEIKP
jgi:hypothetical protein